MFHNKTKTKKVNKFLRFFVTIESTHFCPLLDLIQILNSTWLRTKGNKSKKRVGKSKEKKDTEK